MKEKTLKSKYEAYLLKRLFVNIETAIETKTLTFDEFKKLVESAEQK